MVMITCFVHLTLGVFWPLGPALCEMVDRAQRKTCGWPRPMGGGNPMFLLFAPEQYYRIHLHQHHESKWYVYRGKGIYFPLAGQGMSIHHGDDTCLVF